ncbi:hypothetical protein SASPL_147822 [Salvia splendens]|uniref:Uncharacterized protein n=1 Tax=Salvia splendens TaxID=180675 RepID=A0A8X8WEQ9_SALSN|nr:hypothetical protein SASPL_147822 [Salvia splendens]
MQQQPLRSRDLQLVVHFPWSQGFIAFPSAMEEMRSSRDWDLLLWRRVWLLFRGVQAGPALVFPNWSSPKLPDELRINMRAYVNQSHFGCESKRKFTYVDRTTPVFELERRRRRDRTSIT